MKRVVLLLALAACITDGEVQSALDAYCGNDEHKACTGSECCDGYVCAASECRKLTPGTCLFPGGGMQPTGAPCGCSADCAPTRVCGGESKCL